MDALICRRGKGVYSGIVTAASMFRLTIPDAIGRDNIAVGICDDYNPSLPTYKIIASAAVIDGVNSGAYWRETDGLMVETTQFTFDRAAGMLRSTATSSSDGKPMLADGAKYFYVTW